MSDESERSLFWGILSGVSAGSGVKIDYKAKFLVSNSFLNFPNKFNIFISILSCIKNSSRIHKIYTP